MSEKIEDPNIDDKSGTQDKDGSGAASGSTESIEELQAKIAKLEKTNADQFKELKGTKSKLTSFEKEKEQKEQELMKEQGKYKELAEVNEKKLNELSSKYKTKLMDTQVKEAALKQGLRPEAADTFMKLVRDNYADSVSFDDEFNANASELELFINSQKEAHAGLNFFGTSNPAPKDGDHGGKQETKSFVEQATENFTKLHKSS